MIRALLLSGTTWTTGRNALYAEAVRLQAEQQWQFEYMVFSDADVQLKMVLPEHAGEDPYSIFHATLINTQPAVAGISMGAWGHCAPVLSCSPDMDAMLNAFHATAAPIFLPYDSSLDSHSWWLSQAIMVYDLLVTIPGSVVQLSQVGIVKEMNMHSEYPRGNVGMAFEHLVSTRKQNPCFIQSLHRLGEQNLGHGVGCDGNCAMASTCSAAAITCNGTNSRPPLANYATQIACKPHDR